MTPEELVEVALEHRPTGQRSVVVDETTTANLRWANSTLTTNGDVRTRTATVVQFDQRADGVAVGRSTGPVRDRGDLVELVDRALTVAQQAPLAADAEPLTTPPHNPDLWLDVMDPETVLPQLERITPAIGDVLARGRANAVEYFGYAEQSLSNVTAGVSTGLRLRHSQPATRVELCGKSHGRTRSAWAGTAGSSTESVDIFDLDRQISRGLKWQERTVDLAPGRHPAILPGSALADLMIYLYWSAAARDAAEGRSVFSGGAQRTRVGERLSAWPFDLSSDPNDSLIPCAPFVMDTSSSGTTSPFDIGLPRTRTDWIHDGVLQALPASRHCAKVAGLPHTPPVDNLVVDAAPAESHGSIDDLVSATVSGVLLTCLWYIREVDPNTLLLTGLTRDGVYVVEDGEIVGSAGNFRFNVSPVDLIGRISAATAPTPVLPREWGDYFTRVRSSAVRVGEFNFSSRSQAL